MKITGKNLKDHVSTFEDLEAWQTARRLVNAIYTLTRVIEDFR